MKDKEIVERLNRVFQEVFDDYGIKIYEGMTAADIEEWDSIMQITLVIAVEKEFNIRLNASEVSQLSNIGEMIKLLKKYVSIS
ncbi:MAG: acyl carrier protein [Coxiellaceae bacterium]|jgi:acyl carrier protein|nr:acyl carrier protein [Coxiellaceae bacterium]